MCTSFWKLKQFSGNCRDASIVPITNSLRQRFLRGHNQRRSFVARGKLGGFYRPAARMATIVSTKIFMK